MPISGTFSPDVPSSKRFTAGFYYRMKGDAGGYPFCGMNPYYLSENYLLKGATLGDVDDIHAICDERSFGEGETIVTAGEGTQDIMIILEGRVRVETPEGRDLGEHGPGAMLGEISFLDGKSRTANVVTLKPTKAAVIKAERLRELMRNGPKLELTIYKNAAMALCQRLREANEQIASLREHE